MLFPLSFITFWVLLHFGNFGKYKRLIVATIVGEVKRRRKVSRYQPDKNTKLIVFSARLRGDLYSRVIAFLRQTSKFDFSGLFLKFADRGKFNNYNFHLVERRILRQVVIKRWSPANCRHCSDNLRVETFWMQLTSCFNEVSLPVGGPIWRWKKPTLPRNRSIYTGCYFAGENFMHLNRTHFRKIGCPVQLLRKYLRK